MRTTLTLDDDVAKEIRRLSRETNRSFKQAVNAVMRAGIAALASTKRAPRARYRVKPVSLGRPRLPNLDNIAEVLAIAEGEDHV